MKYIFTREDINKMSYQEFGEVMTRLIRKIQDYCQEKNIKFDLIVPILRNGGIPGSILAISLKIIRMLPIQIKYLPNPYRVEQISDFPKLLYPLPDKPKILICETNTSSGGTAKLVIKLLRGKFPHSKLYYSTVTKVFGGQDKFDEIEEYFFGIQTNEKLLATKEQIEKYNLRQKITLFPWENIEDELKEMNEGQG